MGLNFIRFFWTGEGRRADSAGSADPVQPWTEPDAIFRDFSSLGVQAYRQSVKADLLWDIVEPRPGEWYFAQADAVLRDSRTRAGAEPIVTLFAMQYASPTPPWADSPSEF